MEKIKLSYVATPQGFRKAHVGVVSSGDMEVLYEPNNSQLLQVIITTSSEASRQRWQYLFERLLVLEVFPAGKLEIYDFGATPGVAKLRINQLFEESNNAE